MKVTFIKHSSFFLETEGFCVLFDYYEGELPPINTEKPFYVMASHRHGDHFSQAVFEKTEAFNAFYILSDDIWEKNVPFRFRRRTVRLVPDNEYKTPHFTVKTLRSTDEGVAFLLQTSEGLIYHAGDLNCWKWDGEPDSYNTQMEKNYQKELKKLEGMHIFTAFVPLDPRQEDYFDLGLLQFRQAVAAVEHIFPMHMWGDHTVIARFEEKHGKCLVHIENEGQSFTV